MIGDSLTKICKKVQSLQPTENTTKKTFLLFVERVLKNKKLFYLVV